MPEPVKSIQDAATDTLRAIRVDLHATLYPHLHSANFNVASIPVKSDQKARLLLQDGLNKISKASVALQAIADKGVKADQQAFRDLIEYMTSPPILTPSTGEDVNNTIKGFVIAYKDQFPSITPRTTPSLNGYSHKPTGAKTR